MAFERHSFEFSHSSQNIHLELTISRGVLKQAFAMLVLSAPLEKHGMRTAGALLEIGGQGQPACGAEAKASQASNDKDKAQVKTKRSRRSAEIMVETDEILLIRASAIPAESYCPGCCREVQMVRPEDAARIANVSSRTIYRWVESGKLHFIESPEGALLICVESLRAAASSADKPATEPGA